ncbi:MAG: hypothetical protein V4568_13775 [Pseudomonadota bacterium]
MGTCKRKTLTALAVAIGLGATTLLYAAYASPSDVACLFVKSVALESLPDGTLVEPNSTESERALFLELQSQARARIEKTFGAPRARPIVAFLRGSQIFWPLKVNNYGSSGSIGNCTCVIIGPQGQHVDVVAHELMHQELHERVSALRMFTEVPVWFDEGVAMQVDFRPQYTLPKDVEREINTDEVRKLKSVSQFNHGNDEELTAHYAFAKTEVAQWLDKVGRHNLYNHFERIRSGERFDVVVSRAVLRR